MYIRTGPRPHAITLRELRSQCVKVVSRCPGALPGDCWCCLVRDPVALGWATVGVGCLSHLSRVMFYLS